MAEASSLWAGVRGLASRLWPMSRDIAETARSGGAVLILSHNDPQVSVSGVDRFLLAEINALNSRGIEVFVLSPRQGPTPRRYSWRRGSELLQDESSPAYLREEIAALHDAETFDAVVVHHLVGFDPTFLDELFGLLEELPLYVYLHDVYLVDIGRLADDFAHLVGLFGWREGEFSTYAEQLQVRANRLFRAAETIVAPSSTLAALVGPGLEGQGIPSERLVVEREVEFSRYRDKDPVCHDRLRIAFLGHAMVQKGWEVWGRLVADEEIRSRFDLYHLGADAAGTRDGVELVWYSIAENPYAPVACLHDHEIDLVVLWSLVPESASYTMAEAHAAGVPVLTNPQSGNIATMVAEGEVLGQVCVDEAGLRDFLLSEREVGALAAAGQGAPLLAMKHRSLLAETLARGKR